MLLTILTHLLAAAGGGLLVKLFWKEAKVFTNAEVLLITHNITALKETNTVKYNNLISEWQLLMQHEGKSIGNISTELKAVIAKVKL